VSITRKTAGFTLIELMVVVVIVAILAMIALPSYRQHTLKAHRTDCQQGLLNVAAQQERFFTQCRWYAKTATGTRACGADATAGILGLPSTTSPEGFCTYAITAGTIAAGCADFNCGYTVTATRSATETADGKFRIDSTGRRQWDRNNDGDYDDANEDRWR